jgi:hypothetical protein
MPKSASHASPFVKRMFSGFTSRCTRPLACAAPSALATVRPIAITSASGSCFSRLRRSRNVPPSMNCSTQYSVPFVSPESSTGTMYGCRSPATRRISRKKCPALTDATSSSRSILIATIRPCVRSRARWTIAVAPRPSSRSIAYRLANGDDTVLGGWVTTVSGRRRPPPILPPGPGAPLGYPKSDIGNLKSDGSFARLGDGNAVAEPPVIRG